ncbi:UNVERIFIED_CONTAM: hypothetical protein Slati_0080600 [Sesamum latifolium]|uniref:Transposase MuDR plant domain-containing protein n=1 Tax=Sesamum latifolium TaxID=2727402 RepID=A0AAW2Y864_9LAMI
MNDATETEPRDEVDSDDWRSEFDDSNDQDYVQAPYNSNEDTGEDWGIESNSLIFEDIEASSDEDIFVKINLSKRRLMRKLKKILKQKSKKQMIATFQSENNGPSQEIEWYSDSGEADELHSLDGSGSEKEIEAPEHPYFKEDSNMKTMQLMVSLKFKSAERFRETLRDYCERNGFDLHNIRNEDTRITSKCKNETCNWRIHASPIQEGTTFQIKTVKGEHTCARSYVSK